jgi:membrane associated rhomboid family serine protease
MSLTILIVVVTVILSLMAFNNQQYIFNLVFYPYRMWRQQEWYRLVSCGFIHADMGHLFFNMFALWSFGTFVEEQFNSIAAYGHGLFSVLGGGLLYVIMYFGAVATADLYNLFTQRDNPGYRSLGASGGVSAIVFASILFNPFGKIYLMFIPIGIPSIVFGPLYLLYCVYMAKRGTDNVGHTAHFTGSVFGFIFPILFYPQLLVEFISQLTNR